MSLKHYDLLWVQWVDAEHEGGWTEPTEEVEHEIAPCESVGWLIHENKDRIILSASTSIKHNGSIDQVGNKQVIPRGMITKIVTLRKKKANGKRSRKSQATSPAPAKEDGK